MSSNEESVDYSKSFSCDDELAKARWYNEDLNNGGWREVKKTRGSTVWIKTFPDKEIPIKLLFKYDVPLSAEQFTEVSSPRNLEYRKKWDKAFVALDILEEYPDEGGHIITNVTELPWPLSDREFVLFVPPAKEIEWYGKRAFIVVYVNASHPSRPANVAGGYVRATNGGQFFIVIPDEKDPENACSVFGLSHNSFNGWLPSSHIEWLLARATPKTFTSYFNSLVEGYKLYFGNKYI